MNFSETFIRRPIATSLVMAGIAMFGIIGYRSLPVSEMPPVDYPTINVSASLPGADPTTMSSSVATVLERQFTGIAGLDSMTSRSSTGSTNVTLQFSLDRDIESAAVDVQVALAAVTPLLARRHAVAAFVPQEQSRRSAHRVHGSAFRHAFAVPVG